MDKKRLQLGMNPSTASGRLVKDLLWDFICKSSRDKCFQCGEDMSRDTFSIEHETPWLDSEDPLGLYFDLSNISYSHQSCNSKAGRKVHKLELSDEDKRLRHNSSNRAGHNKMTTEEKRALRRAKYKKYNC